MLYYNGMKNFLRHFFLPQESNNHRPKVLHHHYLLFVIIFFLFGQLCISAIRSQNQQVLGIATNISPATMLDLTNKDRGKFGLGFLTLNDKLSKAAMLKGNSMFTKNYWAHNAPDGTTPWVFIKESGYEYVYAGENLARGFSTSEDVVNAWMASPSHRENMLSENYQDIGFAVLEGKLLNDQTTLVVEMFGATKEGVLAKESNTPVKVVPNSIPQANVFSLGAKSQPLVKKPIIDSFSLTKNIGILTLFFFIAVLVLDMIIVERQKIVRLAGHNFDHIVFLSSILIMIILIQKGTIL